ncbi:hypothetical protein Tsubulata_024637 [Turnera subulata]|uniref:Uncharacterized protein n=1 Tax=Turnera subulata TaxID=218843 RepID=A0A9Q0FVY6_9ROSI|nr:hypothetical protein Tsubulata_024637 [Turnera subulata]
MTAPVSSSCSTDETIVADSDEEAQTATSVHANIDSYKNEAPEYVVKPEISVISLSSRLEDSHAVSSTVHNDGMTKRREKFDESASGNSDIFYTQDLIVRDLKLPSIINSTPSSGVLNFKRFKKENALSGNSFNNLIPFAKFPYDDSDFRNQDMLKSVKEEKRRKQMEAVAEDLFNNEKTRKRGVAGSIHGLLTRA